MSIDQNGGSAAPDSPLFPRERAQGADTDLLQVMNVSVIVTILNEGQAVGRLVESLTGQTRCPDEIVVVDGGSSDDTLVVLEAAIKHLTVGRDGKPAAIRVLVEPGANISRGRNVAIAVASGDVIASTDAGVSLSVEWLRELVTPFDAQPAPDVVSGVFVADTGSVFEKAMAATVLPAVEELQPENFLPSSRSVAFTKRAWEAVGGYPEWLDYCEDLVFDLRLRDLFSPFGFAPQAQVYFRPRGNLRTFFTQYYRYARGDGKADLWRKRHLIRYLSYLVALPAIAVLGTLVSPWIWVLGFGLGFAGHTLVPYRRLMPWLREMTCGQRLEAVFWVPVIRVVGDVAKMVGYPVGWLWRLRHWRDRPEIHWRTHKGDTIAQGHTGG